MSRTMQLLGMALLAGCQTPFGFGGEEWEDNVDDPFAPDAAAEFDTANSDDAGGPQGLASHAYCADGEPQGMAVLVDGEDVWVTHVGFSDECSACASWSVQAFTSLQDVTLTYSDLDASTCDCDCAVFGIETVMTGFATGTWQLSAGDDSVTFDFGLVTE